MKKLVFILCLVLLISLILFAQNDENCSKKAIEGDEIILTPNLARRNIQKEDLIIDVSREVPAKILTDFDEIVEINSDNHLVTKDSELYYSNRDEWNSQIPINTWSDNQKAPNLACDNDGIIYCAFENYDNSHPYTYVTIMYTINGGDSWDYFWGFYSNTSDFLLPSIVYANDYIFISNIVDNPTYGKYVHVVRKSLVSGDFQSFLPPTPDPDDIHRARLCSDSEDWEGNAYLYLAYLYGSGSNDELELYFTRSIDDGENWSDYEYIDDVYKSYWTWDVGIDYGNMNCVFISYLGTGSNQNKLMVVKSSDYGSSWSNPEVIYDNDHNKLGPVVAVHDDDVLIVYQYEWSSSDNDIKGTCSTDCGSSWQTYSIAASTSNEELPWVAHDNAGYFYVTYWKEGEIYAEIGDGPCNVGNPEQINATSIACEDDYTTVIGKTIYNTNSSGAVAAWVDDPWGDLNIWGNYYPSVPDPPYPPTDPVPSDGAVDISLNTDLSWTNGDNTETIYLYFGTYYPPPLVLDSVTVVDTYDPGTLDYETTYYWVVICCNPSGEAPGDDWDFTTIPEVSVNELIPEITELQFNHPNPFNPETTINYSIKENSNVLIEIFNIKGQKVKILVNDFREAGYHSVIWNGKDSNSKPVASGLYFYRMRTDNYQKIRKMILIK